MNGNVSNQNDNVERNATGSAPSGKSVWSEPTMTRLDVAMTQTVFNVTPDGDTTS